MTLKFSDSTNFLVAFDDYDGTADSLPEHQLLGFGPTKREAVEDLMRLCEDYPERLNACREWLWIQADTRHKP